jgi:phosphatidylserine/phosphatidylglycerophosphate/cardiolipin synthase-like enzyme
MKRHKSFKTPTSALIILFVVGFGAGFSARELIQTPVKTVEPPRRLSPPESTSQLPISVCFTPNKRCQTTIVDTINAATKSIYVQAYSFTDKEIASALAKAALRKVEVKVILDKSNRNDDRSAKSIILANHIPLKFDAPNGIAHNKIIIIDGKKVITGSYNYSAAAYKRNTENVLVIQDSNLAHEYFQNWQARWRISK